MLLQQYGLLVLRFLASDVVSRLEDIISNLVLARLALADRDKGETQSAASKDVWPLFERMTKAEWGRVFEEKASGLVENGLAARFGRARYRVTGAGEAAALKWTSPAFVDRW
ncbi:MAG: hypothetical protein ACREXY_02635 [Gammaproteobacteria bacterium]